MPPFWHRMPQLWQQKIANLAKGGNVVARIYNAVARKFKKWQLYRIYNIIATFIFFARIAKNRTTSVVRHAYTV
jgi:hypothetical protein